MDKNIVKEKIVEELRKQLRVIEHSAMDAEEESNTSDIAPSQSDHRSLEASMLARVQSGRMLEAQKVLDIFCKMPIKNFSHLDEIQPSALVELEHNGKAHFFFLGPRGAGTVISYEGNEIEVITPFSPLGQELIDKHIDDLVTIESPKGVQQYLIKNVS